MNFSFLEGWDISLIPCGSKTVYLYKAKFLSLVHNNTLRPEPQTCECEGQKMAIQEGAIINWRV